MGELRISKLIVYRMYRVVEWPNGPLTVSSWGQSEIMYIPWSTHDQIVTLWSQKWSCFETGPEVVSDL